MHGVMGDFTPTFPAGGEWGGSRGGGCKQAEEEEGTSRPQSSMATHLGSNQSSHIFLITTNEYHFWFKKEEKTVLCSQDSSLRFFVIVIPGSNGEDTESLMLSHSTELFIEKPGV